MKLQVLVLMELVRDPPQARVRELATAAQRGDVDLNNTRRSPMLDSREFTIANLAIIWPLSGASTSSVYESLQRRIFETFLEFSVKKTSLTKKQNNPKTNNTNDNANNNANNNANTPNKTKHNTRKFITTIRGATGY